MLFYPKWAETPSPPIVKNLGWNNIVNIWCRPQWDHKCILRNVNHRPRSEGAHQLQPTFIPPLGPCTGVSNIPISRFQNVSIPYLLCQWRQKQTSVVKPMSQYLNLTLLMLSWVFWDPRGTKTLCPQCSTHIHEIINRHGNKIFKTWLWLHRYSYPDLIWQKCRLQCNLTWYDHPRPNSQKAKDNTKAAHIREIT